VIPPTKWRSSTRATPSITSARAARSGGIGFGANPGTKTPIEIIGVVKDAKYTGVRDEIPRQVFSRSSKTTSWAAP
jgi:hypothetical protein